MQNTHSPRLLAIPGPSVIPDRVLAAMHRPSPNIYHGELVDMVDTIWPDLKAVARTKHNLALYIGNGHAAWEASLANVVTKGDRVLVIATGRFGFNWGVLAEQMGIETQVLDFGLQSDADPQVIEDALRADTEGRIKAVTTVQTDTATSVKNDIPAIRRAIDNAGHDALYMVDCIASLGCDRFEMDEWGVDVMVSACQKGLMTPAGLAFVWFNEKAAAAQTRISPSQYWNWAPRANAEMFYQKFSGTAPTHHLYGLREALDMLVHEEGMEACWARHERTAHAVWAALDAWGGDPATTIAHNISDREKRSRAVSAVWFGDGNGDRIRSYSEERNAVTLGISLGFDDPEHRLRIGHMGAQSPWMTLGMLGSIEASLQALNIPHGPGALEAAAAVFANANNE